MVLISAFTSIRAVATNIAGVISKLVIPDIFQSIDIIGDVQVPMLLIHGKKDDVIPYSHAMRLYEKSGSLSKRLELSETMGHNRCRVEKDIFIPIEKFLIGDLRVNDFMAVKSKVLDLDKIVEDSKNGSDLSMFSTFVGSSSSVLLESIKKNGGKKQSLQPKIIVSKSTARKSGDHSPFISPLFKSLF